MKAVTQVRQLAQRDFMQRARSRVFLISTLVIMALIVSLGPLLAFAIRDDPPAELGVTGTEPPGLEAALQQSAAALEIEISLTRFSNVDEAEQALADGDVRVVLTEERELVWAEEPSSTLTAIYTAAVAAIERSDTIDRLGLTQEQANLLISPAPLASRSLTEADPEEGPRAVASQVGAVVLYAAILMFGQFVMLGVMEEKTNRVVEVVLSRVRPHQILAGKVIGIGLLGLLQLVVLSATVVAMLFLIDLEGVDLPSIGVGVFAPVVAWFLLGYALFSLIYASLGALVSRQEDAQSVAFIPVLLILPGYFLSLVAGSEPDAVAVHVASLIPPMSPMVMPIRAAVGDVPVWEIALAVVLLLIAAYGLIRLGGRVYKGAILRTGAKVKIRDAWKASTE